MSTYFRHACGYFWLQSQLGTTPRQPLSCLLLSVATFASRCVPGGDHSVPIAALLRAEYAQETLPTKPSRPGASLPVPLPNRKVFGSTRTRP